MTAPAFQPIDWRTIRDTLWQWFREVSGCETIWADQDAPQPAYPYASLNILPGTLPTGALDEERINADGSLSLVGPRDFVLSCQIHAGARAGATCDARMRADAIVASLAIPVYRYALRNANLGLRERGAVQMLDLVVGAEWMKRAQVDIRFGTMSNVDIAAWPNLAEVGWFDKVEATANIDGAPPGIQWTDKLLDPNA
jgi:hypothetical protein